MRRFASVTSVFALLFLAACQGTLQGEPPLADGGLPDGSPDAGSPDAGPYGPILDDNGCDVLSPTDCGFPFPSDVYLADDPTTVTGHHVEIPTGALIPMAFSGSVTDLSILRESDGFSPGVQAVVRLPGATTAGLPDANHVADSLLDACPTVLLDTVTGQRVPHWAELDQRSQPDTTTPNDTDAVRRALLVRPAQRLASNRRYVVAIRGVLDAEGHPVHASPAFSDLRDGKVTSNPSIELRRAKYTDIFARLETIGVHRETLQIAWDFTTSSEANNTRRLLSMRDRALAELGDDGAPAYTITSSTDDPANDAHVARILRGTVTVPMYLSQLEPGGTITVDDEGLPIQNGTAEFPFVVVIPKAAETHALPVLQFGHGLFGNHDGVLDARLTSMADTYGTILLGLDWLGLSSYDLDPLAAILLEGDMSKFATVPDRGQQAMLNAVVALRMVTRGMVDDPDTFLGGQPTIDPASPTFFGASLGGIYGSTYMAISTDLQRGALGVPGQSFDLLLPRSDLFDQFALALGINWQYDRVRYPLFLSVAQMLWDRCDPTGYSHHLLHDPLPGTTTKEIFVVSARGDHKVSNYATHVMARSVGFPLVEPIFTPVFGVSTLTGPTTGAGWIEIDFGKPPIPVTNVPARDGADVHDAPFGLPTVQLMISTFLQTGVIENQCTGACDPE